MAFKFLFFHLITALVAVNLIFASEDDESDRFFPFLGGGGSNNSGGFLGLPFGNGNGSGLPNLPFFGFFGNGQLPSFFGPRQERSADHHESEESEDSEGEPQDRLFFGNLVSCNYTTQGGTTCSSCRQSLACFPNNVGRLRTCRGLFRYCNNGRCSFLPGAQCSSSSNSTNSSG